MTALIYLIERNEIRIAMDTACHTLNSDGKLSPHIFMSKIHFLPHLGAAFCGTGAAILPLYWYSYVQQNLVVAGLDSVAEIADRILPSIWNQILPDGGPDSTLYMFGFSESENRMLGYCYRTTYGFQRETLGDCLAIKPHLVVDFEQLINDINEIDFQYACWQAISREKRADEEEASNPVGIGGEVHFARVTKKSFEIQVGQRFSDFNQFFDQAISSCSD